VLSHVEDSNALKPRTDPNQLRLHRGTVSFDRGQNTSLGGMLASLIEEATRELTVG
jgi:hypothetical protein